MSKTYIVGSKPIEIQSRRFSIGELVGTGDIAAKQFTPAEGLEEIVGFGHVETRFADGRIVVGTPIAKASPVETSEAVAEVDVSSDPEPVVEADDASTPEANEAEAQIDVAGMSKAGLVKLAEEYGIDLGNLNKTAEIRSHIKKMLED